MSRDLLELGALHLAVLDTNENKWVPWLIGR